MVDVSGHVAMGMLWAIPAWFLWRERVALTFVAITALFALLPDVDLWLERIVPAMVHHHGVTHTIVFVLAVALVVAALAAWLGADAFRRRLGDNFTDRRTFRFSFAAVAVGGLSHLFADSLSAPDIAQPIEPLWPLFDKPWSFDLIWYDAFAWNFGFLFVVLVLHAVVAYAVGFGDGEHGVSTERHH